MLSAAACWDLVQRRVGVVPGVRLQVRACFAMEGWASSVRVAA